MIHQKEPAARGHRATKKATPQEIAAAADPDALVPVHVVAALIGLSGDTVRRMAKAGRFPKPHALNSHVVRWRAGDVRDWLKAKTAL